MQINNKILLAGTDLDGTLFNSSKKIDARTRAAIRRASEKGIRIVLVTGRPLSGISDELLSINEIDYAITNNGAEIIDLKASKPIFSRQISNKTSLEIISRAKELGVVFEAFTNGYGYITQNDMAVYMQTHFGTPVGDYIQSSRKIVDDVLEFMRSSKSGADEIFIMLPDDSVKQSLINMLADYDEVHFWLLENKFLEITHIGADKGKAFAYLADYLGISRESTIAFGDGENDIALLGSAAVSVAMGNASKAVKEKATLVTTTNDDYGVAKILEQL